MGLIAQEFEKFDRQAKSAQTVLGEFAASLDKIGARGRSAGAVGVPALGEVIGQPETS